jgi:hypothetical protein
MLALRRFLLRDQGESSIMVLLSQNISLIVMAALGGLMFVLITGGVKIQGENNGQTQLTIATRAFSNDAANASTAAPTDGSSVTFISTNFLKASSPNPDGSQAYLCRESKWYIAAASSAIRQQLSDQTLLSIYNDITVHSTSDCTSAITSTQHRIAVNAIYDPHATNPTAATPSFSYVNIAGVPLNYSNGIVTTFVGLDPTSTATADEAAISNFRSTNNVPNWYTDSEALRESPKKIKLQVDVVLPITAKNPATFEATTDQQETELAGNNNDIVDPGGEQTRWIPNPVSAVYVTRGSAGNVVGGVHEGLQISWAARPSSECSPSETETYEWLVTNVRTGHMSSGETTADLIQISSADGDAEIWNGGIYKVSVSSRCNDTDGQSGDTSYNSGDPTQPNYQLPLPGILNVAVDASNGETTHTVTWTVASSDPTTTYTVGYSPAVLSQASNYAETTANGNTAYEYPNMHWSPASGSPSASATLTTTGNTVVAGFPDTYQVRAETADDANTGGIWTPANWIYSIPAPAAPTITSTNSTAFSWTPSACSPSTTPNYRAAADQGDSDTTASALPSASVQTANSFGYSQIGEGKKVFVRADENCNTAFTFTPTNGESGLTSFGPDATSNFVRPVDAPSSISVTSNYTSVYLNDSAHIYGLSVNGCPAGTSGAWTRGGLNVTVAYSTAGYRYFAAYGDCIGDYATSGETAGTRGVDWIVPAPDAPSAGCSTTTVSSSGVRELPRASASCNSVAYATSYAGKIISHWNDGTTQTYIDSGSSASIQTACESDGGFGWINVVYEINASNAQGTSGYWSGTVTSPDLISEACF